MCGSVECVLWRGRDQNFTDAATGPLTSREVWQFTSFHADIPAIGAWCQHDPALILCLLAELVFLEYLMCFSNRYLQAEINGS